MKYYALRPPEGLTRVGSVASLSRVKHSPISAARAKLAAAPPSTTHILRGSVLHRRLGEILFNTTIATAIADRLMENSEIFLLGGDSLRKPSKNPNPPAEE